MATLDEALQQMLAAGLPSPPDGYLVVDGRMHRYGPKKRAWYVAYEYLARNGRRYVSGAYGYWGLIESTKIRTDWSGVDQEEQQRLREAAVQRESDERAKRERLARFAAQRALSQWNAARARLPDGESCPYLQAKGVAPANGLRFLADGTLLVPMVRYDVSEDQAKDPAYSGPRRLAGLQKIAPDGAKRFNKGMAKEGTACRLGRKPKDGETILIGEGLATVLSVLEALDRSHTAFVAFDAGNLLPVARIVRGLYPNSPILFLADDDAYLELQLRRVLEEDYGVTARYALGEGERAFPGRNGTVWVQADAHEDGNGVPAITARIRTESITRTPAYTNTGRAKAWAAAAAIGNATVCWPAFAERDLQVEPKLTDFNDLHRVQGVDAVRLQVGVALQQSQAALDLARSIREASAPAPEAKAGGGTPAGEEPDWGTYGMLLRRFTQVYPSDEAFDDQLGRLVKIPHMKLMFGNKLVNMWLASAKKRTVLAEDVVFDPTGTADSSRTVNLFRGLKPRPAAPALCRKLLDLLHYLCGEDPEDTHTPVTSWVLRWAAYPLQHVGAKMQTAVVMYGEEGTGKNLFWGALRSIYGQHGGVITQMQLQSQFNDWLSAKLFLIANEVVTRAEIKHHVGILKNLITEPEIWINPKHIGARMESNHCNLVFLSNELQPLQLGPRDRRYMVIKTPAPRPEALYREVGAEIAAGGLEALHAFLLDLDLGDFTPHTKPLGTEAREELIEQGLMSSQLFWKEMHDGLLGVPYCPALTRDVYRLYTEWCRRNGERMPQSMSKFKPAFMSLNGVRAKIERVRDPDSERDLAEADDAKVKQRTIFLMGETERDAMRERLRVQQGVVEFRKAMNAYLDEERSSGNSTPHWMKGAA